MFTGLLSSGKLPDVFLQPVYVRPAEMLSTLAWKAGSSWHMQCCRSGKGTDFNQDTWPSPRVRDVPDL